VKHDACGILTSAKVEHRQKPLTLTLTLTPIAKVEAGKNSNASQYMVLFGPAPQLDGNRN